MTNPMLELQAAVFTELSQDGELTGLIGQGKLHDLTPAELAFPYITFGRVTRHDWSTASEDGAEIFFSLHVWSRKRGKAQTLEIMERVTAILHDRPLALADYHLINLRVEQETLSFNAELDAFHGSLRLRAVIENAAG